MLRKPSPLVLGVLLVVVLLASATPAAATGNGVATGGTAGTAAAVGNVTDSPAVGSDHCGDRTGNVSRQAGPQVQTLVAPDWAYSKLTNASDFQTARDEGALTAATAGAESPSVARMDVAVHRVEFNETTTDVVDQLVTSRGTASPGAVPASAVDLSYLQTGDCEELTLDAGRDPDWVRVVPDRKNESVYVVVDLQQAAFERPDGTTTELEPGEYRLQFGIPGTETATASTRFRVVQPAVRLNTTTPGLVRPSVGGATLDGETTLAPGTQLVFRLRPLGARGQPLTVATTVNQSRAFAVDIGGASARSLYAVDVYTVGFDTGLPVMLDPSEQPRRAPSPAPRRVPGAPGVPAVTG